MTNNPLKLAALTSNNQPQIYGCRNCKAMSTNEIDMEDHCKHPTQEDIKQLEVDATAFGKLIQDKARRMHSTTGLSGFTTQDLIDELRSRGFRVKP